MSADKALLIQLPICLLIDKAQRNLSNLLCWWYPLEPVKSQSGESSLVDLDRLPVGTTIGLAFSVIWPKENVD